VRGSPWDGAAGQGPWIFSWVSGGSFPDRQSAAHGQRSYAPAGGNASIRLNFYKKITKGCWIQIRKRPHDSETSASAYVAALLGLPENFEVESIVAVGYPGEEKAVHPAGSLQREKVSFETYGQPQ
jgi:hypothetical protein